MLEEKLAHFPEPVIISKVTKPNPILGLTSSRKRQDLKRKAQSMEKSRLDECYLGFNNWRPPWGWKRFSLFISKISRFSRTSNDGELEREHSHREPVSLRRKLKRQSTSTIDKSLPAEGRDKPALQETHLSRHRDPSRREDHFAATISSAKKGREPPSVRTTPLEKIFLERQTPQLEEILLEREDPQTHGESRQATRRRFRVNASTAEKDSGTGGSPSTRRR
ncbi:unnamed protein product [Microthlaspi erraticum]|uniref:Uncharacterized protein n=1 Tax=Microthlaspi erraticum TaxID=1685480 RepID=A0A6D2JAB7_9BRAS|nr:unnamed protein product [Microthlaspi erraticum]